MTAATLRAGYRPGSKLLAWHFVAGNRMLRDGSLLVEPGYIYSIGAEESVEMCEVGMHASRRAIDALQYAPGPVVCRVRLWGDVREDADRLVARHREVLWMADATRELHQFGVWCVRHTPLADGRTVWHVLSDLRSRRAVTMKESWLRGEATDSDLSAARSAAMSAAESAAMSAAMSAAESAANSAANSAAESAAQCAAWSAAESAAWSAAWSAARSAAESAQNTELTRLLRRLASRNR
jgi:hypothetical protein